MIDDLPGARQGAPGGWYAVAGFAMRVIVDRLSKTYRDRSGLEVAALEDIALRVEPEEFVAVLGPSGCGKSTLLGIVAGLLPATSGQVFFEGARRGGQPLTATVFQEFALFPWRTVQGNVEFGLEELATATAERKARAARFIAMTGLEGFVGEFALGFPFQDRNGRLLVPDIERGRCSGGERGRCSGGREMDL
jgi:ABC-type multidrug transport system ATPase subunit